MGFDNWKRFASGVKDNGVRGVPSSKKNEGSGKRGKKLAQKSKKGKKAKRSKVPAIAEIAADAKWRAQSDADALMTAKEILEDKSRLKKARVVADEKAKVARQAADSIKQL